jgi:cytochrome b561
MSIHAAYSRTQIALHWIIAAIVAYQILFSEGIEGLWRDRMTGAIPNEPFPVPHALAGLLILVLMIWRVVLRLRRGAPPPPAGEHTSVVMVAKATHALFYLLLIGMPVSGAVAWFGGFELPAELHGAAGNVLILLIVLHVAAALAHQFWWKTDVLRRMTRAG